MSVRVADLKNMNPSYSSFKTPWRSINVTLRDRDGRHYITQCCVYMVTQRGLSDTLNNTLLLVALRHHNLVKIKPFTFIQTSKQIYTFVSSQPSKRNFDSFYTFFQKRSFTCWFLTSWIHWNLWQFNTFVTDSFLNPFLSFKPLNKSTHLYLQ